MKNLLISVSLILLNSGCSKDVFITQNACSAANPLTVQWVKDLTGSLGHCVCSVTLFQGTYNGQTVFYTLFDDANCDTVFSAKLLDCYGNLIKVYGSSLQEMKTFANEVKIDKRLYTCQ